MLNLRALGRALPGLVAGSALLSGSVAAEEEDAQDGPVIDEIVVTALKRAQPLSDVGVSVTAFTGADLEELGLGASPRTSRRRPPTSTPTSCSATASRTSASAASA